MQVACYLATSFICNILDCTGMALQCVGFIFIKVGERMVSKY